MGSNEIFFISSLFKQHIKYAALKSFLSNIFPTKRSIILFKIASAPSPSPEILISEYSNMFCFKCLITQDLSCLTENLSLAYVHRRLKFIMSYL